MPAEIEPTTHSEMAMPFRRVSELPKGQTDLYNAQQKQAFLKAFNRAYEEYDHNETRALAAAHDAAKRVGEVKKSH